MSKGNSEAPPLGQWTTGLCGCFEDPGNCCLTSCCPCVTFGKNAEIIDNGRTSCANAALIFYTLCQAGFVCLWIYSYTYRTKLRGIFKLPQKPCSDFCVHCWCACCALCQEYRELKNRGVDPALGWTANVENMKGAIQVPPPVTTDMTP